jgi:hypothetical protein
VTLAVHDARSTPPVFADGATTIRPDTAGATTAADQGGSLERETDRHAESDHSAPQSAAATESPTEVAERRPGAASSEGVGGSAPGVADPAPVAGRSTASRAESVGAIARGARQAVAQAVVAGALADVLPVDAAAVERALREVLDQLDALAAKVLPDTAAPAGAGLRLVAVAALVAGVQLVVVRMKTPGGGPVLVLSATNTSWSWVIGSGTRQRRCGS